MLVTIKVRRNTDEAPEERSGDSTVGEWFLQEMELAGWGVPVRTIRVNYWVAYIYNLDEFPIKDLVREVRESRAHCPDLEVLAIRKLFKTRSYV